MLPAPSHYRSYSSPHSPPAKHAASPSTPPTQRLAQQVLAQLEELRIGARVRAGTDQTLTELAGLCARLGVLLRRKGSAAEVVALLKQVPTLLRAIRPRQDPAAPEGTMMYVEAPNHDAQVRAQQASSAPPSRRRTLTRRPSPPHYAPHYTPLLLEHTPHCTPPSLHPLTPPPHSTPHSTPSPHPPQVFLRLSTNGFALLAPLVRPTPGRPELLREALETLAAALRECATNQAALGPHAPPCACPCYAALSCTP